MSTAFFAILASFDFYNFFSPVLRACAANVYEKAQAPLQGVYSLTAALTQADSLFPPFAKIYHRNYALSTERARRAAVTPAYPALIVASSHAILFSCSTGHSRQIY
jgi:hypothetical protein